MMNKIKLMAATVAMVSGLGMAGTASAQAVFNLVIDGTSPSAGYTVIQDFNGAGPYSLSGSNYIIHPASSDGTGASPRTPASAFLSVLAGGNATYTFANAVSAFQFDWGTVSADNVLTVFTTTGSSIFTVPNSAADPRGPNYEKNALLTATAVSGLITSFRLDAATNAFEIDNVAIQGAVPEPATWAMMIGGFGFVGGAMRRRSKVRVAYSA